MRYNSAYILWSIGFLLLTYAEIEVEIEQFSANPFVWGVATAAYQIEGAVSDEGRGATIWDTFSAIPGKIDKGDTGATADGAYYKIKEDVQLIKNMGLKSYRFSISWSRIMPTGQLPINQAGIDHYNLLINELIKYDIKPLVTLYHWDLPLYLEQSYGGWLNPIIEKDFVTYADTCFQLFGDRVKWWSTINEPWTFCLFGYVLGTFAPGRCSDRAKCPLGDSATEGYIAAHNVLNSHASAVELYRRKYQGKQNGKIGIVLNQDWAEPLTQDPLDIIAANTKNEFTMAWFGDPIVYGKYPDSMIKLVGERLPKFTEIQRNKLIGSYDYFALNHYSTKFYYDPNRPMQEGEIRILPPVNVVQKTNKTIENVENVENVGNIEIDRNIKNIKIMANANRVENIQHEIKNIQQSGTNSRLRRTNKVVENGYTMYTIIHEKNDKNNDLNIDNNSVKNSNKNKDKNKNKDERFLFDTDPNSLGWAKDQLNMESKYDSHGQIIGMEGESSWLHVVPWGFYNTIMWNSNRYTINGKKPIIYITENGCDVPHETEMKRENALKDTFRIEYYRTYLLEMERAMSDGADVRGYYAWSLMDNFE